MNRTIEQILQQILNDYKLYGDSIIILYIKKYNKIERTYSLSLKIKNVNKDELKQILYNCHDFSNHKSIQIITDLFNKKEKLLINNFVIV